MFFGAFLSMKWRQAKTSKMLQGKAIQVSYRCLRSYIYKLSKHHTPSQASTPAKHYMPTHMSALAKHPHTWKISHHRAEFPKKSKFSTSPLTMYLTRTCNLSSSGSKNPLFYFFDLYRYQAQTDMYICVYVSICI